MNQYEKDVDEEMCLYYIRDKAHEIENKEYFDVRFKNIDIMKMNIAIKKYEGIIKDRQGIEKE